MSALDLADTSKLTGRNQEMLARFESKMGLIPNLLKQMANSPAALEAFLSTRETLANGLLSEKMRVLIGIQVGEIYSCEYLLSIAVAFAQKAGFTEEEIALAKQQSSKDPKLDSGLSFARNLILRHADLPAGDVEELKAAGFSHGEVVELVGCVMSHLYTYYLIQIAQPAADFPRVATAFPA